MPLKANTPAPDFTLPSTSGTTFTLSKNLAGKPGIIYFYPKDFTPGCTKEACEFRDTFSFFRELDIPVIGISRDTLETHRKFKAEHRLPFELLSDEDGKVAEQYNAIIPLIRFTRRVTYLLNRQHVITAAYENLFGAEKHIQTMIQQLKRGVVS